MLVSFAGSAIAPTVSHREQCQRLLTSAHCCCREKAQKVGAAMCAAMKDQLSRQMFEVVIQAAANGKIIARETMKVHAFIRVASTFPHSLLVSSAALNMTHLLGNLSVF